MKKLLMLISSILLLSGCNKKNQSYDNVIIFQSTSNSTYIDMNVLLDTIKVIYEDYGNLMIIIPSSEPEIVYNDKINLPDNYHSLSKSNKDKSLNSALKNLDSFLTKNESLIPDYPEVDVNESLQLACDFFEQSSNPNRLFYIGNGLGTHNPINLTNIELNQLDIDELLDFLMRNKQLVVFPDHTYVEWKYFGETYGSNQEQLTQNSKHALKEFYDAYFKESNIEIHYLKDAPIQKKLDLELYPYCTPVTQDNPS